MTQTFSTPAVPQAIKDIRHPAYKNIYEYNLGNRNLWGTETLFGDWSGKTLIVAKDFYPTSYIENAIEAGDPAPYRHGPKVRTNVRLINTLTNLGALRSGALNVNCGFLYASASFLLRADGSVSGALPDERNALTLSTPVLSFTIENMTNLKNVIAMGEEAARALSRLQPTLMARNLCFRKALHTARASTADLMASWRNAMG